MASSHPHHHHQIKTTEKSMVNDNTKSNNGLNYLNQDHNHNDNHRQVNTNKSSQAHQKQVTVSSSPSSPSPSPSPPSSSSSPSHEFSFTISLLHSAATSSSNSTTSSSSLKSPKSTKVNNAAASSFAIDLSPADDIFFHGHLLPLHFLSHLPSSAASVSAAAVVSPRSSTNSLDSFTLPITDFESQNDDEVPRTTTTSSSETPKANKLRSFSLFNKWKKVTAKEEDNKQEKINKNNGNNGSNSNKLRFDVSQVLKRYMRMVRPLAFFKGGGRRRRGRDGVDLRRQPYSFSGVLSPRNDDCQDYDMARLGGRKRPGEYSAPASMRTSPSNSGLLVATATATLPSGVSDSTMEELQAAIQAAIAHCKNSSAGTDNSNKKL